MGSAHGVKELTILALGSAGHGPAIGVVSRREANVMKPQLAQHLALQY